MLTTIGRQHDTVHVDPIVAKQERDRCRERLGERERNVRDVLVEATLTELVRPSRPHASEGTAGRDRIHPDAMPWYM